MKELLQSDDPTKIARVFKDGGIVIFPTDTVWGIGCVYDNDKSIKSLYKIKKRQADKPSSLLIPNITWVSKLAKCTQAQYNLLSKYWPGSLTVVLPAKDNIVDCDFVSKNGEVGLRIPDHYRLLEVLKILGKPILGPSANFAGKTPPSKKSQLDPKLIEFADAVFDSRNGHGLESTVITFRNNKVVTLRAGAVKI